MRGGIISVKLNTTPQPCGGFLVSSELELSHPGKSRPYISYRIPRREAECLFDMRFSLLTAAESHFGETHTSMRQGAISIQSQCTLEFRDGLGRAVGEVLDQAHAVMRDGMIRSQRQRLDYSNFGRSKARRSIGRQ